MQTDVIFFLYMRETEMYIYVSGAFYSYAFC